MECEKCQKVLKSVNLKAHMKIHSEKALACKLCYKTFLYRKFLNEHQTKVHKNEAQYLDREILDSELIHNCDKCSKRFVLQNLMEAHRRRHDLEKFEHLRTESFLKSANRYECKLCYSTYDSFSTLVSHFKTVHKSDLERVHEKITTADLVVPCKDCDLRFITQAVLNFHTSKVHKTKINEQKCGHCPEVFNKSSLRGAKEFRRHLSTVHKTRILSKVLNCKLCEKPIRGRRNLKTHTTNMHTSPEEVNALTLDRIDEEDLRFLCKYCDKKFLTEDVLRHHKNYCQKSEKRNQKSEKRNQSQNCENCPSLFPSFRSLMKHSSEVHNIKISYKHIYKIIKCKLCDKPIKGKSNLRSHEKSLHTTPEEAEALKGDNIEEQLLSVQCLSCGKRFLNERTLKCHNSFCNSAGGKYSTIYGGKKDCMLCLVSFKTTLEFGNHVHSIHRKFDEEISALKSLQAGQQISLQSQCKFCQKKLLNRHVLKCHFEKIHSTEQSTKTWECEFCKKEFKPEKRRRSTVGAHMRDEHDLPEYNCLEGNLVEGGSSTKKTGGVGNQAKQNFQLMLAKMLGVKT